MSDQLSTVIEPAYERDDILDANSKESDGLDTSDLIPDRYNRMLAEKELAYERLVRSDASGPATGDSSMATISYEEAVERELEYQKRKNLSSLQPPLSSPYLSIPCHPSMQGLNNQPPQFSFNQQPWGQGQQYRQTQPNFSMNQQPRPHLIDFGLPAFWCNTCKVNCVTPFNFKVHLGGKKHITNMEGIDVGKKKAPVYNNNTFWCKECNASFMTEMALAQHCAVKKHMIQLQANSGAPRTGMNMHK